jgi:hypothetical protein
MAKKSKSFVFDDVEEATEPEPAAEEAPPSVEATGYPTGRLAHDKNVAIAQSSLQGSLATATTQAAANSAYITFQRAVLASALANGISPASASMALAALGTWG